MRAASLYTLLIALALASCGGPSQLSYDEAEPYLLDQMNQQAVKHAANGYEVEMKQLPTEYLALREAKTSGPVDQAAFDSLQASYGDALYFLLTIKPQEGMREGDIVLSVDGVTSSPLALNAQIYIRLNYEAGDKITVKYQRNGKTLDANYTLKAKPW